MSKVDGSQMSTGEYIMELVIEKALEERDKEWTKATGLMSGQYRTLAPEHLEDFMKEAKEIFIKQGREEERNRCLQIIQKKYDEVYTDDEGAGIFALEDAMDRIKDQS